MAVNEVIVTGRVKRRLIDKTAKLWQRLSYWTKASDVEFDDGKDAETKLGDINSALNTLNTNLGGFTPVIDETGRITGYKTTVGADTVFPFKGILQGVKMLGNVDLIGTGITESIDVSKIYPELYTQFTEENFIIVPDNASITDTSSTGTLQVWRTLPTKSSYSNKLDKLYDSTTGVFSFNFILNRRSIIDGTGYTQSADANATLNVPCSIYVVHPDIDSKTIYEVGVYGNSATIDMSYIEGFNSIWESDIVIGIVECNTSGNKSGTSPGHGGDGNETRRTSATASYDLSTSYERGIGQFKFTVNLSGFDNNNNIQTKVYIIK